MNHPSTATQDAADRIARTLPPGPSPAPLIVAAAAVYLIGAAVILAAYGPGAWAWSSATVVLILLALARGEHLADERERAELAAHVATLLAAAYARGVIDGAHRGGVE